MKKTPRVGVFICRCGTNIANVVDVPGLQEEFSKHPLVACSKEYSYFCSNPGQDLIKETIKEEGLDRVVVAACSPRLHQMTFRRAARLAGLNPYLTTHTNIREQDAWVHDDKAAATNKARNLINASIMRVIRHDPLERRSVSISKKTLVLGGGIAGMTAALEIASAGYKVYLVERASSLGGVARGIDLTYPDFASARGMVEERIAEVDADPNIEVFLEANLAELHGYVGNFEGHLETKNGEVKVDFGLLVVATGLKPFDASRIPSLGHGEIPDVVTSVEFEARLAEGRLEKSDGSLPKTIGIIHCVGSLDEGTNSHCSRICCLTALKFTNQIKAALPGTKVVHFINEMRSYGKGGEELYDDTARLGVPFYIFAKDDRPVISRGNDGGLVVDLNDRLAGPASVPVDTAILMVGEEAHDDALRVSQLTGVSICKSSFFIERHPKLDPVGTASDGVFIAGACQGPKGVAESVSQARAAAAAILAIISRGEVDVEVTTAEVNEDLCCGCRTCVSVCPYGAVEFNEERGASEVNEIVCKGCGACGAACPMGAISCKHYRDDQILAQIEGLLAVGTERVA